MLMQEFLVLALIFAKTSHAALGFGGRNAQKYKPPFIPGKNDGFLRRIATGTRARFNRVFGRMDETGLKTVYKPLVNDLQKTLDELPCVEGVFITLDETTNFKLNKGTMNDLDWSFMMPTVIAKKGPNLTALVQFTFPVIELKYDFELTGKLYHTTVTEMGSVVLRHEVPVTIEYTIQLPKSLRQIRKLESEKKCVATIQKVKTILGNPPDPNNVLSCEKIMCDYMVDAKDITQDMINKMIKDLTADTQMNLQRSLLVLLDPIVRNFKFNCKDPTYEIPKALAIKPTCDYYRSITEVYRPPDPNEKAQDSDTSESVEVKQEDATAYHDAKTEQKNTEEKETEKKE